MISKFSKLAMAPLFSSLLLLGAGNVSAGVVSAVQPYADTVAGTANNGFFGAADDFTLTEDAVLTGATFTTVYNQGDAGTVHDTMVNFSVWGAGGFGTDLLFSGSDTASVVADTTPSNTYNTREQWSISFASVSEVLRTLTMGPTYWLELNLPDAVQLYWESATTSNGSSASSSFYAGTPLVDLGHDLAFYVSGEPSGSKPPPPSVPVPSPLLLMGLAALGLARIRRRG